MQIYRVFRLTILLMLGGVVAACASEAPPALPTPTALPRAVMLPISSVLAAPQQWSGQAITVVAAVALQGDDRALVASSEAAGDPSSVASAQAIWLEQPVPEAIAEQVRAGNPILKVRGTISPPGAYGRDQRFPYQISADKIEAIQPERTTLANLAQNPQALDQILLTVEGTLLFQPNSALLTDQVSEGGIPTGLHQIKLPGATLDQSLLDRLERSGEVRWGMVEVIGWWQNGALTPFKITPAASNQ